MTITAGSHYRGVVRISRERFSRLLTERANPAVIAERDPGEYYDTIVARNCDPLYILAMFGKESTWGQFGVAATSKSWGNTRAPNFGASPVGEMPGRTGTFPVWATWFDGCVSTVERLMAQDWYYSGEQRTIGEVNLDPHWDHATSRPRQNPNRPARPPIPRNGPLEWAPAGDLNSPTGYLSFVLNFMNQHQDVEDDPDLNTIMGVPFRQSFIPATNRNRPGGRQTKTMIVNHETGNSSPGTNAEMHRRFTHGGGGSERVSFHLVVDDTEIIQLLPFHEIAWHGGDGANGPCNLNGIAIEHCVNADGNWRKTLENGVKLNVWLMKQFDLDLSAVRQHWHCSGKGCPSRLRSSGWEDFLAQIGALAASEPDPGMSLPRHPELDAMFVEGHGFGNYMHWLMDRVGKQEALYLVGFPITGETDEDGLTVQYTERMRFEWHPGSRPNRDDVLFGRTGAELLEARMEIQRLQERISELEAELAG